MSAKDVLQDIIDRIEDEGDRVYLGSTNDLEGLKRILADLDLASEARKLMRDLRAKADV